MFLKSFLKSFLTNKRDRVIKKVKKVKKVKKKGEMDSQRQIHLERARHIFTNRRFLLQTDAEKENTYRILLEKGFDRDDCIALLQELGLTVPAWLAQVPISSCGFREWNRVFEQPETCKRMSRPMHQAILRILDKVSVNSNRDGDDLIYYHSHIGDAVKNLGSGENYDYLTPEFKALGYDDKITVLKEHGLREPDGINFKQWLLQQWGKNTMRYAKITNSHLMYIQSDFWYCAYPSMFAEAMCSSGLFTGYNHYPGSGFHFYGDKMDLFCVGSADIELEVRNLIRRTSSGSVSGSKLKVQFLQAEQCEWWNMTDEFLLSFYSAAPQTSDLSRGTKIRQWMFYPASVWPNVNLPILKHRGTVRSISGSAVHFANVATIGELNTYTRDLHTGNYIFMPDEDKYISVSARAVKLPLAFILGKNGNKIGDNKEELTIYSKIHVSQNPTDSYILHQDMIFAGTISNPVLIVGGQEITIPAFLL